MTHTPLRQRLIALFADVFQTEIADDIDDISSQEIASWDSINKLRLVLELEQVFNVGITDREAMELDSLRRAEAILLGHGITADSLSSAVDWRPLG